MMLIVITAGAGKLHEGEALLFLVRLKNEASPLFCAGTARS